MSKKSKAASKQSRLNKKRAQMEGGLILSRELSMLGAGHQSILNMTLTTLLH